MVKVYLEEMEELMKSSMRRKRRGTCMQLRGETGGKGWWRGGIMDDVEQFWVESY